jgi:V8-like Glu-specific endopeptidase
MLTFEDRSRILEILKGNPFFLKPDNLEMVIGRAGLDDLLPAINLNGTPQTVLYNTIIYLDRYGKVSYDHFALGRFLNSVIDDVGVDQQNYLRSIISKYNLMSPVSVYSQVPKEIDSVAQETKILQEAITGKNTLRPIAFLSRGIEVSRCVCWVSFPNGSGTGFLLDNNILLTCNHVIPETGVLDDCLFRFNYQLDTNRIPEKYQDYRFNKNGIFYTNQALDCTLLELEDFPGTKWGHTRYTSSQGKVGERVNIIQHPAGAPKHISIQNNFLKYVDNRVVQYLSSTLPGASGAPVFNDNWQVLALHQGSIAIDNKETGGRYYRNQGVVISAILRDLPQNIRIRLGNGTKNKSEVA